MRFLALADAHLAKSPSLPSAKNFGTWLYALWAVQYGNKKDGAIADGGSFVLTYWQFLLQSRL